MRDGGHKTLNFRVIAEHLNTSKANIHHHFGNKEGLANEVINDYSSKMLGEFKRLAAECDSDLSQFIKEAEDLFWSACLNTGHCVMCLCDQVTRFSEVPNGTKRVAQEFYENLFKIVRGVVKKALKKGDLRPGLKAEQVTHQILMLMNGLPSVVQMKASVFEAEKTLRGTIQSWVKTLKV